MCVCVCIYIYIHMNMSPPPLLFLPIGPSGGVAGGSVIGVTEIGNDELTPVPIPFCCRSSTPPCHSKLSFATLRTLRPTLLLGCPAWSLSLVGVTGSNRRTRCRRTRRRR